MTGLISLDRIGRVTGVSPAHIQEPQTIIQGNNILHGVDPDAGAFIEIAQPGQPESGWFVRLEIPVASGETKRRLAAALRRPH
jgi:hypothetical protein